MKSLQRHINEAFNIKSNTPIKLIVNTVEDLHDIVIKRYKKCNKILDLTDVDIHKLTNLVYSSNYGPMGLFADVEDVEVIDLTGWNTSNIKSMKYMFFNLYKLKEIKGIENFDVSCCLNFQGMFYGCLELKRLNLSKWKINYETEERKNFVYMFGRCHKLSKLSMFNVPDDYLYQCKYKDMFNECKASIIPYWYASYMTIQ